MRVLVYRYNSICEPDYIEAFQNVGLEVSKIEVEMTDKSVPLDKRVELL